MRTLRYSINVTLDGCCDHRAMFADEDLYRHVVENLDQADALLFGRVTYEMMEAAWRPPWRLSTVLVFQSPPTWPALHRISRTSSPPPSRPASSPISPPD